MNTNKHGLYMGIRLRNNIPGHLHGCPNGWMSDGGASSIKMLSGMLRRRYLNGGCAF
jgi:hypothetical protein